MAQWGPGTGKSTGLKIGVGATVTALAVTGAVLYPGHETADVDLNDGGVWVVNQTVNKVGHLNYQSRVLDGGVLTPLPSYDLAQEGERVFVRNLEQASLNTIDPAAKVCITTIQRLYSILKGDPDAYDIIKQSLKRSWA